MSFRVLTASVAIALALSAPRAVASPAPARPSVALTAFRLHVSGAPDRGTTFWVAYGPLAGRFGIVRLRDQGAGVYTASARVSTAAKANFTFLAGHGVVRTRAGLAPGNPVVTIRTIGPISVWPRGIPAVRWRAPAG